MEFKQEKEFQNKAADSSSKNKTLHEWQEDGVKNTGHWRWVKYTGIPILIIVILLSIFVGPHNYKLIPVFGIAGYAIMMALKPFFKNDKVKDECGL